MYFFIGKFSSIKPSWNISLVFTSYWNILKCFRALKTAQQKLRSQQQAAAQLEEQRKKEEVCKNLKTFNNNINNTNDVTNYFYSIFARNLWKKWIFKKGRSGWFPKKFLLTLLLSLMFTKKNGHKFASFVIILYSVVFWAW